MVRDSSITFKIDLLVIMLPVKQNNVGLVLRFLTIWVTIVMNIERYNCPESVVFASKQSTPSILLNHNLFRKYAIKRIVKQEHHKFV